MDSSIWLSLVVAIISSGLVGTLVTAVAKRISDGDPSKIALKLLIQDKLEFLMQKEIDAGETSRARHKMIEEMYQAYHDLKGNGDMKWLKEKYDDLPVKKEETEV